MKKMNNHHNHNNKIEPIKLFFLDEVAIFRKKGKKTEIGKSTHQIPKKVKVSA